MYVILFTMKKFTRRHFLIFLFLFIILALITGYYYKDNVSYENPDLIAENEARAMAQKVGLLVILPTDETPTVATVSAPHLLKDQIFFKEAKKGDIVLIYANARKAVLYDPGVNKIVNISNISIDSKGRSSDPSPSIRYSPVLEKAPNPNEF